MFCLSDDLDLANRILVRFVVGKRKEHLLLSARKNSEHTEKVGGEMCQSRASQLLTRVYN